MTDYSKMMTYSTTHALNEAATALSMNNHVAALQWLYTALQCARRPAELAYSPVKARAQRGHIMQAIQAILPMAVIQYAVLDMPPASLPTTRTYTTHIGTTCTEL